MAVVATPVSVPTGLGAREPVDLSQKVLNFQRLEHPNTSLWQCGTKYGNQVVRSIFDKLQERDMTPTFEEIILSDNKIGDEGAKFLQEGLMGNKSLKKLLAARCDMKAEGFKYMGKLLGDSPSLEEIVLSSNWCDNGLKGEFCEGLTKNKNLKSLYLGVCRLGNEGVRPLLQGPMKTHPALEHLSLTYNRLGAPSVNYLNEALAANKALKYLDLSGNSLGPEGAEALVKGLKANKGNLKKLSLAQNEIRHSGCRALTMFFLSDDGKKMEFCDLRHNLVTYKLMVELRNEIKRPLPGDVEKADEEGWLLLFNGRQLFLNAH